MTMVSNIQTRRGNTMLHNVFPITICINIYVSKGLSAPLPVDSCGILKRQKVFHALLVVLDHTFSEGHLCVGFH